VEIDDDTNAPTPHHRRKSQVVLEVTHLLDLEAALVGQYQAHIRVRPRGRLQASPAPATGRLISLAVHRGGQLQRQVRLAHARRPGEQVRLCQAARRERPAQEIECPLVTDDIPHPRFQRLGGDYVTIR
jgi:hypothetical protein